MEPKLSLTESNVLKAFVKTRAGTNDEISTATGYTSNTVRNMMVLLRAKYGVENRAQLFLKVQNGK